MKWFPLPLRVVEAAAREARLRGVSVVARSPRGFLLQYVEAGGRVSQLDDYWRRRRDAFIARHMAQVRAREEPLWKNGEPTRRHLALAVWAYSPTPSKLARWLGVR